MLDPASIKALIFDVFGTVVDWRTSIARESELVLKPKGYALDWLAFADAWRDEYQPAMEEVRSGKIPFSKLDVLHRRNLERILPRFKVSASTRRRCSTSTRPGTGSTAGPTRPGPAAAAQEIPDRALLERQHLADVRHRAAQQFPLGRDPRLRDRRRLQAEACRLSQVRRGLRLQAARMRDGRGALERSRLRRRDGAEDRACGAPERARPRQGRAEADRAGRYRGGEFHGAGGEAGG